MTVPCLQCGTEFIPNRYWQKYCSKHCGYRHWWEANHPEGLKRGRPSKKYRMQHPKEAEPKQKVDLHALGLL